MEKVKESLVKILESRYFILFLAGISILCYFCNIKTLPYYIFGIYLGLLGFTGAKATALYMIFLLLYASNQSDYASCHGTVSYYIGVGITAVGGLISLVPQFIHFKERWKKFLDPVFVTMILTVFIMMISIKNTPDTGLSWGGIGDYLLTWAFMSIGLFYLDKEEDTLKKLLFSVIIAGAVISLQMFYKFIVCLSDGTTFYEIFQLKKVHLGWGNVNNAVVYLSAGVLASILLLMKERKLLWNVFYTVTLIVQVVFVLLTASRGGYIGLAVTGILAIIHYVIYSVKNKDVFKKNMIILGVGLGAMVLVVILAFASGLGSDFLKHFSERGASITGREDIYKEAMTHFKEHWLFGGGVYSSSYYLHQMGRTDINYYHGYIFQCLGCLGIAGLICFTAYLCFIGYRIYKYKRSWYGLYAGLILIYFLIHGAVDNLFYFPSVEPILIIMISML